ncbi:MAG: tRNA (guanosine(37)-N1)-methyltransferase TrmD [Clostridia bacterium]|nr:tRNA (guanosine(37)-N1)-methyltransferase TrmD [Clostridia bacterium]
MKIDILTLFPETFSYLNESIIGRAQKSGALEINVHDIRNYSTDKHKKCDDYPFGGGAGMVMMPQPVYDAINAIDPRHESIRIFTSPKGKTLSQGLVCELAKSKNLLILCGHYEGIDERIIELCIDLEVSIGDYVLTGGELPAMVITDAVSRYVSGVINENSLQEESFSSNLLEYPQYTRPQDFKGVKVPDVLLSGNHAEIEKWRKQKSLEITKKNRPDLLK